MIDLRGYRARWVRWVDAPHERSHGITFDRTPAGAILAPAGLVRVCAWHVDFDERPTCYVDVPTVAEAVAICAALDEACGANVDFATAYDDAGALVAPTT